MAKDNKVQVRTNWEAVFVAYCNGAPVEELAQIFDVTLEQVRDRIHRDRWAALRANLPLGETLKSDSEMKSVTEIKLAAIQANREANLKAWAKLRDHAVDIIEQLQQKKLKMEKVFNGKLGIARVDDLEPTTGDMVNIATYLQTISNGSYRALGDFQAQDKPGQDGLNNGQPAAPAITIILPNCIASPRQTGPDDSKVINLRPSEAQPVAVEQLKSAKPTETTEATAVELNPKLTS
jgi:hypothetical protein